MAELARHKNFVYGDIWRSDIRTSKDKHGRMKSDVSRYTNQISFVEYLREHDYSFYLDYDFNGYAHTDITNREVVVNANYPDSVLEVFLKHELGHLLLFDVNQFTTIRNQTLRSSIAKILYTPDHMVKYGMEQLLYTENIIQDVIIETVSNGKCVCHALFMEQGENAGVKHLDHLESATYIAKEVCGNVLKPKEEYDKSKQAQRYFSKPLEEALDSMLDDLKSDSEEIRDNIKKTKTSNEFNQWVNSKREREIEKLRKQLEALETKLAKLKEPNERLEQMRKDIKSQLRKASSKRRLRQDARQAEQDRANALGKLEKSLDKNGELKDTLEEARAENAALPRPPEGMLPQRMGDGPQQKGKGPLQKNLTDHLSDPDAAPGGGHSYDCGFPHPISVKRDESIKNEMTLVNFDTKKRVKKIHIDEDDMDNVLSNKNKIPESEVTYFKANKKEFNETDMLKGKKKLRISGINVLIGLDVSGSMSQEWTTMFTTLSEMVMALQETLEIDNIIYFTYNTKISDFSRDINDLTLKASGGNAFGYVYQEMMQKLPIALRNEIILVTDCGDNLGFTLKDNCEVQRGNIPVINHISIIDTENRGFYNKNGFDEADWSLYYYKDPDLFDTIKLNLETLIDR